MIWQLAVLHRRVVAQMDELDIVNACQGWHLVSTDGALDAPTTMTLHLYDAFSLHLQVAEDIAGTKSVRGHLAVLPPGAKKRGLCCSCAMILFAFCPAALLRMASSVLTPLC